MMKFTLTSSSSRLVDAQPIKSATFTTKSWIITVLPHHEALMTAVEPCLLSITDEHDNIASFALGQWIAHIEHDKLMILADMANDGSNIDQTELANRKEKLSKEIAELKLRHANDGSVETMQWIIDLETQFLKESALEMLAIKK